VLRILGSRKIACDGLSRRDLLHLGGLGLFGFGLGDLFRLQDTQAAPARPNRHFGRARACILIHLFGAHPQHETFDPKPAAPAEIQGELKAIATPLPGVQIGEGLPRVARMVDRLTLVRSLTHPWPFHGVHYALSGIPEISPTVEADPNDRTLWPFIGSVVDYLQARRARGVGVPSGGRRREAPTVPANIALPFRLYSRANFRLLGGPYAGFLGSRYDPVWTDFSARGTRAVPNPASKSDVFDPFGGIRPDDRFRITGDLADDLPAPRLAGRRALVEQFDRSRAWLEAHERVQGFGRYQELAYSLLTSPRLARALEVQREPSAIRAQYGMTLFGQSLLAARRLVEAGGRFVTVFWDAYGDATAGWDTHYHHYPRLKELLLPGFDLAFSALVLDLEARGLLDETLVLVLSEHGRTPRLTNRPGGGREHWSAAYCGVLAGGGVARGKVVGRTDSTGGQVADTPVSPKDVLATALYLLGIDPHTTVLDRLNRPVPVAGDGVVRAEFFD
jgi:hypothetical protein